MDYIKIWLISGDIDAIFVLIGTCLVAWYFIIIIYQGIKTDKKINNKGEIMNEEKRYTMSEVESMVNTILTNNKTEEKKELIRLELEQEILNSRAEMKADMLAEIESNKAKTEAKIRADIKAELQAEMKAELQAEIEREARIAELRGKI